MTKANLAQLKWEKWVSPKRKFSARYKDVSAALGDVRNAWPKRGHPFNLELVKVAPGKAVCPFHSHTSQWELFVILRGTGLVRADKKRVKVKAGDVFMHPPGEAHQLINTGKTWLHLWIIADNPPVDIFHYPDSNKWGLRPQGKFFRITETPYNDGEE
jgi:uncharacterized cupin superfamily protein